MEWGFLELLEPASTPTLTGNVGGGVSEVNDVLCFLLEGSVLRRWNGGFCM